jgi:hypothetical protein
MMTVSAEDNLKAWRVHLPQRGWNGQVLIMLPGGCWRDPSRQTPGSWESEDRGPKPERPGGGGGQGIYIEILQLDFNNIHANLKPCLKDGSKYLT